MNNKIYFTPGPSELYPSVRKHMLTALDMKIGAISHRSKQYQELSKFTTDGLKTLLGLPENFHVFFLGSATEIWERIMQNCVEQNSFHFVNGSFSKRFYEFSLESGKKGIKEEAAFGKGFNIQQIDIPKEAEIICVTHNETSSGVSMPVSDIHTLKDKHPDSLLFVDAVSSLPYPDLNYNKIDSVFFSVQKCFGLPAGLGVWIVNDKCIAKANTLKAKGLSIGTYHTLPSLLEKALINQTPETPNVINIYLLGKVVEEMNNKGAAFIRQETDTKAKMVYDYLNTSENFSPFVQEAAHRSQTTIVADTKISSAEVNKKLEPHNMTVGSGYSSYKDKQVRIANFPTHSVEQMEQLVKIMKKLIN